MRMTSRCTSAADEDIERWREREAASSSGCGEWDSERLRAIVRCAFLFVYTLQRLLPKETAHCHESAEAISLCDAACAPIVRRPPRRPPCWCSIIARSSWPSSLFERLERVRLPIGAFDDDESAVDGGAKVIANRWVRLPPDARVGAAREEI